MFFIGSNVALIENKLIKATADFQQSGKLSPKLAVIN